MDMNLLGDKLLNLLQWTILVNLLLAAAIVAYLYLQYSDAKNRVLRRFTEDDVRRILADYAEYIDKRDKRNRQLDRFEQLIDQSETRSDTAWLESSQHYELARLERDRWDFTREDRTDVHDELVAIAEKRNAEGYKYAEEDDP